MTNLITKIAITSAVIFGASTAAQASDTFTARFHYDASISAADNLQKFEVMAENVCANQMAREGYRLTEGRFQRRQCQSALLKQAVRATKKDALTLAYAQNKTKRPAVNTRQKSRTLLAQK